jgi:hypothetical protein
LEKVKKIIGETQETLMENAKLKTALKESQDEIGMLKADLVKVKAEQKNIEELRKLLA